MDYRKIMLHFEETKKKIGSFQNQTHLKEQYGKPIVVHLTSNTTNQALHFFFPVKIF